MKRQNRKSWHVAVLPGDGVGSEVVSAALLVLNAVKKKHNIEIETEFGDAGLNCISRYGTNLPEETVRMLKKSDCALKGPMTTPEGSNSETSAAVKIRKIFDLYANVRPVKSLPTVEGIKKSIDLVIVRENTEGLYSGLDFRVNEDVAIAFRVITKRASERIGKFALNLAEARKRHLTIVHKGNILKESDALLRSSIEKQGKNYKGVKIDDAHVDAMAQWLIKNPELYDVIVTENLFGDILSDEAAMLVGGVGVAPSANIGEKFAMFEPIHGSAPKYAGQNKVNPIATILSVKMMLEWMGYKGAAEDVQKAVEKSLEGGMKTYDLGGKRRCSEVGRAVADSI